MRQFYDFQQHARAGNAGAPMASVVGKLSYGDMIALANLRGITAALAPFRRTARSHAVDDMIMEKRSAEGFSGDHRPSTQVRKIAIQAIIWPLTQFGLSPARRPKPKVAGFLPGWSLASTRRKVTLSPLKASENA